ncbi:hypothetical protein [Peribacillus asahii]|uniref:hypothetical protein n=1 Tax=Peribacillus asahii TaxID=228899 RepID=UPI00207AC1A9|nr:hypothetical protein [Peribacillus asahii]USK72653.1 hypothetical protein LIS76_23295 [Peribacillus asahii]
MGDIKCQVDSAFEHEKKVWSKRRKLVNFTSEKRARKYLERIQPVYAQSLQLDQHSSDGWVIYYH